MKRTARRKRRNAKNRTRAKWRKVASGMAQSVESLDRTFARLKELDAVLRGD